MIEDKIVITSAVRTPIGSFQGSLSKIKAPDLGSKTIKSAIEKSNLNSRDINEVIMGCVLPAGLGQAPARQAALGAGIEETVGATTINKMCGSGMKSAMLAHDLLLGGEERILVAGGMENMSRVPHVLPDSRVGQRLGDRKLIDSMVHDGLWCCFSDSHMGTLAEKTAIDFEVTRSEQDEFALGSNQKASKAIENGSFVNEISPVVVILPANVALPLVGAKSKIDAHEPPP